MNTFLIVFFIVIAVLLAAVLIKYIKAVKIPKQSIVAFTGTLGSGKSYLAVSYAVKAYRRQNLHYKIYSLFMWCPKSEKLFKSWQYPASLYSNIPIRLKKGVFSEPLTKEHLLNRGLLPEKCVVLIDELGSIASQWDFDNPFVLERLEKNIRFFRHWLDGKMYVTDQVATNIVKPIRSRLGIIYFLLDFKRWIGFTPFYKVTTFPLLLIEDNSSSAIQSNIELDDCYFFGYLPYRHSKNKYNSRTFKPIYRTSALRNPSKFDDTLLSRYLIDISVSKAISREYQSDKAKYKEYIYEDVSKPCDVSAPINRKFFRSTHSDTES